MPLKITIRDRIMFNQASSLLNERNPETLSPARKKIDRQDQAHDRENATLNQLNIVHDLSDTDSLSSGHTSSASDKSDTSSVKDDRQSTSSSTNKEKYKQKENLFIREGVICTDLKSLNKQIMIAQAALVGLQKTPCHNDEELNFKIQDEMLLEAKLSTLTEKKSALENEKSIIIQKQEQFKIDDTTHAKFRSAKLIGRGQQSLDNLWARMPNLQTNHVPKVTTTITKPKVKNIQAYFQPVVDLTKPAPIKPLRL